MTTTAKHYEEWHKQQNALLMFLSYSFSYSFSLEDSIHTRERARREGRCGKQHHHYHHHHYYYYYYYYYYYSE